MTWTPVEEQKLKSAYEAVKRNRKGKSVKGQGFWDAVATEMGKDGLSDRSGKAVKSKFFKIREIAQKVIDLSGAGPQLSDPIDGEALKELEEKNPALANALQTMPTSFYHEFLSVIREDYATADNMCIKPATLVGKVHSLEPSAKNTKFTKSSIINPIDAEIKSSISSIKEIIEKYSNPVNAQQGVFEMLDEIDGLTLRQKTKLCCFFDSYPSYKSYFLKADMEKKQQLIAEALDEIENK
jgi:hypothetical protein